MDDGDDADANFEVGNGTGEIIWTSSSSSTGAWRKREEVEDGIGGGDEDGDEEEAAEGDEDVRPRVIDEDEAGTGVAWLFLALSEEFVVPFLVVEEDGANG